MRLVGIALFIMALAAPIVSQARSACPERIKNYHECSLYLESLVIQSHPNLFVRAGSSIKIKLRHGNFVRFDDTLSEDDQNTDDVIHYAVVKYFSDIRYALVAAAFWEGGTYYLLNMTTGAKTEISGDAVLSPDKRRLAVWYIDMHVGYSPNVLAVYRISARGPVREFMAQPNDWGPTAVSWQSSRAVTFTKNYWGENGLQGKEQVLRFRGANIKEGGAWQVE
jgi:hypothetical protein